MHRPTDPTTLRRAALHAVLASTLCLLAVAAFADTPTNHFTVTNSCPYDLWIEQDFKFKTPDPIVVQIPAGESYDYEIPAEGLASTRFWAKANCNIYGYDCAVGESVGVPSAQAAGHQTSRTIYDPPIDSKFEATWGCLLADPNDCAANPSAPQQKLGSATYWDGSAVDGYTFAYTIDVSPAVQGGTLSCADGNTGQPLADPSVDCGKLHPAACPTTENLSTGGEYNNINGHNVTSVNLQYQAYTDAADVVGCFSPCTKLTSSQWEGWATVLGGLQPNSPQAQMYCCPTPPVSAADCRAGVAATSEYHESIHTRQKCNAYAYAYDDGIGLVKCEGAVKYELTICPNGNSLSVPTQRREPQTFCNPNTSPPQVCPNGTACPDCGEDACPCPL
ncbi:MAG: hypothetical protein AAGN46_00265 [Acidobacteriota bacterium]